MGITGLRSMKRQVQHEQHSYRTIIVWVCSVIDQRRHPNVVGTLVTNSAAPSPPVFLFSTHFDVICDLLLTRQMVTLVNNKTIKLPVLQNLPSNLLQYHTILHIV